MGNEMGNNNTSELREDEDSKSTETEGKAAQEPVHSGDLKEENHVVPAPQTKDYHEKETELASDHPKAAGDTNGTEQKENGVHLSVASPEYDQKLIEETAIDTVFQTTAPLLEGLEDCGNSKSSNIEDNVSVMSKHQIENESSFKKEEEEMPNTTSVAIALSRDESKQVEVAQSEKENTNSPKLVENEDGKSAIVEAKIEEKIDGEISTSNGTNSMETQAGTDIDVDVSIPEDKCIILSQQTKSIGKESKNGDCSDSEVDSSKRANCINEGKEDPIITVHNVANNGVLQVEGMEETDESCDHNMDSEGHCRGSEPKFMMEESLKAESNIANGKEPGDCKPVSSEGSITSGPELAKLSIINATYIKEEPEDYKSKEEEPEKEQTLEVELKTEGPVVAEVDKPCFPASLLQSEDQQQKAATKFEDAQVCSKSTSEVKLERSTELLVAVALPLDVTSTSMETLVQSEDQQQKAATQFEDAQVRSKSTSEPKLESSSELLMEVALPFNAIRNSMETLVQFEDQQKKAANEFEHAQVRSESTSEANIESSSELLIVVASPFDATSTFMETLVQSEDQQQKAATEFVDAQVCGKPTSEAKLEGSSEFLVAVASPSDATSTSMETLVQSEDQQQEAATKFEDAPDRNKSTSEEKIESSTELLVVVASPFDATSTSMETLAPAVELPIEKHEEAEAVLDHALEIPQILTETNSSASENGVVPENLIEVEIQVSEYSIGVMETAIEAKSSVEQTEKVKTSVSSRDGNEEQESAGRFSTELIPDNFNARAEMRKSPSFSIDLRIEARHSESDRTPLLYQNQNTNQDDARLHNSLLPVEYNGESLKYQPLSTEEKVITLERSDSDKSKTPFPTAPKQLDKPESAKKNSMDQRNSRSSSELTPSPMPLKSKEKHKRRSSLFTNCMCCTTVIN